MMSLTPDLSSRNVGDLVAEDFRRAPVFRNHGIEFCCGGGVPLEEACRRSGADLETVVRDLAASDRNPLSPLSRAVTWTPAFLVDYIETVHHAYVREAVPALRAFTAKVARVHGGERPELVEMAALFEELASEMEEHMAFEEAELFPAVRRGEPDLAAGLSRAEDDHVKAGELMADIRRLSSDFTPPDWACRTYRAAFANLEEFERDLHVHVHLENNVLFPRVGPNGSQESSEAM